MDGPDPIRSRFAIVDVTTLSQHDAMEYRHELIHALRHPGTEFDEIGEEGEAARVAYKKRLKLVDAHIATFPSEIAHVNSRSL